MFKKYYVHWVVLAKFTKEFVFSDISTYNDGVIYLNCIYRGCLLTV